ncbi:MAG: NAD(+) diphosphatase [Gammaproteobacteria bacterium]|jgi:NAD+ diphosphatase|nr:NAD(+) diphosphatase [Gammaproteobacteria bacterium]MBT4491624.1 NAD(+) diphosphatase [Gammaproteobacteria bacterium]MBT7371249.1 NAD(+) diphosphatase [Gammaproteobacteria bacterium]
MDWEYANIVEDFQSGVAAPDSHDNSYHIVISDGEILCIDGQYPWRPLNQDEWRWCGLEPLSSHYLGRIGDAPIFAEEVDPDAEEPDGYEFETLWGFLTTVDQPVFDLIGRAKQLVDWHQHHHFCGACGGVTSTEPTDRSRKCESCDLSFYPRLAPSIIVLVYRGEELLLAKNANTQADFYSTLAGFVEPGESIEETVHREVFEEVGVKIKNLKYFNSQSWPFPNSLMLGFFAEYDSGEINIQEEEIADAQWFHYKDLPNNPAMMSISGWLIDDHIKRMG